MTDDQNMALNQNGEETVDTTPVVEETTDTQVAESVESKKGATQRVQEAVNRAKAAEEKAKSLEQKLAELTNQVGSPGELPPYSPPETKTSTVFDEETEKTLSQREQRLQQAFEVRLQQERAINNVNRQAANLVKKYSVLNPESDDFNQELSDAVVTASEAYVKSNPFGNLEEYVAKIVKPYQKAVKKEVAATTEDIAKQVQEAAIRPTVAKTVSKNFKDLSIAEMEAQLGFAQ